MKRSEPEREQPPKDLGPCARCVREAGIVVYGRQLRVQGAILHPLHDEGPGEPLCGYHAELAAWERAVDRHVRSGRPIETAPREPIWRKSRFSGPDGKSGPSGVSG